MGAEGTTTTNEDEDLQLEERIFQTKLENDCLIKAFAAITLQNLSVGGNKSDPL